MDDSEFIKIKNVSKNFDDVIAVDNVNIDIAKGEFFSLLGPSGCGKTTLLRILAGFEYPSSGEVLIDNVDVTDITPNLRPTNIAKAISISTILPVITIAKLQASCMF